MSRVAVQLHLVDELVEAMAGFEARARTAADEVDVRLRRVAMVWTGVAATQQAEAHARWAAGAREMHDALAALRTIAATAHANYAAAVRANLAMWA